METVGNQKQVSHRSHRPWKSLRDSHTSHRSGTTDVNTITKTECYQFFFRDFVSGEGCSALRAKSTSSMSSSDSPTDLVFVCLRNGFNIGTAPVAICYNLQQATL